MQNLAPPPDLQWPPKLSEVPKAVFHREDVYEAELDRIFRGEEWHPLAHMAEIPAPGDYKTTHIGSSPVLVVHGSDGVVRAFENSCTHRGTQLATCPRGNAAKIECPYHRWNFSNTGELLGTPGRADFPKDFNPADYALRELRSAIRSGLVFATYSASVPDIDDYLGSAAAGIAQVLGEGPLELLGYQKVSFATNWKEYADNEGYHAPLLHSAFVMLRWKGGQGSQLMTDRAHKVIRTDLTVPPEGFLADHSLIDARDPNCPPQSVIVSLFPVTIILKHLDVISVRYAFPRSAHETEVHYAYFVREDDSEELKRHRLRQSANLLGPSGLITLEDGAVFNRLHVGSRTSGSVEFQKGVSDAQAVPTDFSHTDEAGNLVRWEHYRKAMGFTR
jgi:anthranilate 1,2-dioxygenase large subunit